MLELLLLPVPLPFDDDEPLEGVSCLLEGCTEAMLLDDMTRAVEAGEPREI